MQSAATEQSSVAWENAPHLQASFEFPAETLEADEISRQRDESNTLELPAVLAAPGLERPTNARFSLVDSSALHVLLRIL